MVRFVAFLETTQNGDGVFDGRFADKHLLEAALERGILLNELTIFVEGGGSDESQLAASEHWLKHVGSGHGSLATTGTHERVELVDEGDDLSVRVVDFFEHSLKALFKFASVLRTGNQGADVE